MVNTMNFTHTHTATITHACNCSTCSFSSQMPLRGIGNWKIPHSRFPPTFSPSSLYFHLPVHFLSLSNESAKCNCSLIWLVSCVSMSYWNKVARDAVPKSTVSAHMVPTWKGVYSSCLLHLDTRMLATNANWLNALYTFFYRAWSVFLKLKFLKSIKGSIKKWSLTLW